MEALFSQLSLLSAGAFDDEDFDPSRVDYLFELFEGEALASCAAAEAEHLKAAAEAEAAMEKAEYYFDSAFDAAAGEFLQSSAEVDEWMGRGQKHMEMALVPAMAAFTGSKIQPF